MPQTRKNGGKIKPFKDVYVIYWSRPDDCWTAHSLRTDQIGIGDCVVEALSGLIRAVDHIVHFAERDDTLAVFREAPSAVRKKAENAQKLPEEVYEIAYKRVHGDWPKRFKPEFKVAKTGRYVIEEKIAI